jgi:O-antigen ligase
MNIQVSLRYYSLFLPQIALFFLTVYLISHAAPPSPLSPPARGGEMKREMMIEKIINVLIIVSTISAIIGILQFVGLNYEHGIKWNIPSRLPDKTDIYSTYGNPNFMSSFLAAVFPLILINLWHNLNDSKKRLVNVISALIILFCILISRTKAAWLGVIISTVLLLIFVIKINIKDKAFKKYLKASGIIFLAIIAIITGISLILPAESNPILAELSSLTLSNITFKGRELMWFTTFNMIKDHPVIGIGVNAFRLNYQNYQAGFLNKHPEYIPYLGSAESPHNQFLEITAEQGIVGVLLFLWINIVFFKSCMGFINKTPADEAHLKKKMIVIGIMAGVAAILIHGLVEFPLNLVPNAMLYWIYLGFVMVIQNKQEVRSQESEDRMLLPISQRLSYFIIIISLAISLFFIWSSLRPLIASKIHRDAWHLMQDEKWKEAAVSAKEGVGWDPLNDELHLFLGVANYHLTNYSESLKEYAKAYELYPDYMIPYNIGLIHKKMGSLTLAEEYFKKTIFLRPNLPEPYTQLSQVYKEMGKIDESIDIFNKGARYRKF